MGLDGVPDAGPEAESTDNADRRTDLQLEEHLYAHGHGREPWRGTDNKAAMLLDRISEWLKQFIKPAQQLDQRLRWGEMLTKIFVEFGRFPLGEKSECQALAPVNCRI